MGNLFYFWGVDAGQKLTQYLITQLFAPKGLCVVIRTKKLPFFHWILEDIQFEILWDDQRLKPQTLGQGNGERNSVPLITHLVCSRLQLPYSINALLQQLTQDSIRNRKWRRLWHLEITTTANRKIEIKLNCLWMFSQNTSNCIAR